MGSTDRLSAQDATFLYAETPMALMHVGSMAIFEDAGLSDEQFNAHIESRLHLVPRFRKKLAWVPLGLGRPVWIDDPHFDIRFHIRHTGLPKPHGMHEAKQLMGRIMSRQLDRKRPLWEMWLFHLPEGQMGVIQKTHHALIDGISGVDVGTVMLDLGPEPVKIDAPPFRPEPKPEKGKLMRDAALDALRRPRDLAEAVKKWVPGGDVAKRSADIAKGLVAWGKASVNVAPTTSLTQPIGSHRRFEIIRAKLADVKAIRKRFGCTVNDVILATVAGGLGKLLRSRGESIDDLVMKAMVPVSVRDKSQRHTYGNHVSMMTAELPVGERDGDARIRFVSERMKGLKESKQAVGADFWVKMSEYAPPTVLALSSRAITLQRIVNLVVTNVPGPQFPLYMQGGKMLEAFPFVPILGTSSVGVAVLSYNGQLNYGLTGDWDVVPDLHVLAEGIEEALDEQLR